MLFIVLAIRKAGFTDRESICRAHAASIREICRSHYSPDQIAVWSGYLKPQSYDTALRTRDVWVACEAGAVVAFVQFDPGSGELEALYVDPNHAGRGVGRRLVQHVEGLALSRGFAVVRLCATLNAVPFYSKQGFEIVRELLYHHPSGVVLACMEMHKRLETGDSLHVSCLENQENSS